MKYFLKIAIFFYVPISVNAQEKDFASINYSYSKVKYNDTLAKANQLEIKIKYPLLVKDRNTFVGIISFKNLNLNNFPVQYVASIQGIAFQMLWQKKISENKKIDVFNQVGLFSDMADITTKDFRYGIGFRVKTKHNSKLTTGYGLSYSKQFFGNQIIPFIDIDYRPNNKWSLAGQLPMKPKILYHFNEKIKVGFELSGEAASYRFSEIEFQNKFIQVNQWTGLPKL